VRAAKAEVRKLKPQILVNPLLVVLEEAVSTSDPGHEPLLSTKALVNEFASVRHLKSRTGIWPFWFTAPDLRNSPSLTAQNAGQKQLLTQSLSLSKSP